MFPLFRRTILVAFLSSFAFLASAEEAAQCAASMLLSAPTNSFENPKYSPDRRIDVLHVLLDVRPDFKQRTVSGKMTMTLKPIAKPLRELSLDAVDLKINSVDSTEKIQAYQAASDKLTVTFAGEVPAGREIRVTVAYEAEPKQGLYFRTPEMGYKTNETHLFTQGEAIEARHWYPCYDAPNEKFTSEIICHAAGDMTVLANGRLLSDEKEGDEHAVRWLQDKPHANYLIALVVGYFKKVEDTYRDIPLALYVLPSHFNEAASTFADTKKAMAFFEKEIGVPYPWAKYYQVAVNDFHFGGMENTTLTVLTDGTFYQPDTENLQSSRGLISHELAHQWFGDLVTCKDWSHLWLNEGFATYYASLYEEEAVGRDTMLAELYDTAKRLVGRADDSRPMIYRKYDSPDDMALGLGDLSYGKGAWILHMLRNQLGTDLYRQCIKTYVERHAFGNVTTDNLNAVIEELSGRSYDRFFDQWVYHGGSPQLDISYRWNEQLKLAQITVNQNQKISDQIFLFEFPLKIRFKTKQGKIDREIQIKAQSEDFTFPLESAPEIVRIDPDLALLANIKFHPPAEMLKRQVADDSDALGRLIAVEQLAGHGDHETIKTLQKVLQTDSFFPVRMEASRVLRGIHSDESFTALEASRTQPDARVREQVITDLGGFYKEAAFEAAMKVWKEEKNPQIRARALPTLAAYSKPEVRTILLQALDTESYRNSISQAAISAIRAQQDPSYLPAVLTRLKEHSSEFSGGALGRALDAIAYLGRNEEKKDPLRDFLLERLNDSRQNVRRSALTALGTLQDPKALAALEKFAGGKHPAPEKTAAERSIAAIQAARKPVDDFQALRGEILTLQKENRELQSEMKALKKQFDAIATRPDSQPKSVPARKGLIKK